MSLYNHGLCLEHIQLIDCPPGFSRVQALQPGGPDPRNTIPHPISLAPTSRAVSGAPSDSQSLAAFNDSSDSSASSVSSEEGHLPPTSRPTAWKKGKTPDRHVVITGVDDENHFQRASSAVSGRTNTSDFPVNVPKDDSDSETLPTTIPKPEGEAGRPRRGGYNLEEQLGWEEKFFKQVKSFVKQAVIDKLDPLVPFTSQPSGQLQEIRDMTTAEFPALRRYVDCWVVDDLIRCLLKYQRQKTINQDRQRVADRHYERRRAKRERKALHEIQEARLGESSRAGRSHAN
ncbi:hypothetical protein AAF712_009334 [Marasmius tenuissimus]|uniref:Uncharacterized protein n=1 Tax=Marasmius tenuissimus TaxID=585030 RepID=A0ABR2ZTY3_9AGAR